MEQISLTSSNIHDDSALSSINVTNISQSTPIKADFNALTYSTPIFQSRINHLPVSKPRVNFHSIADLIGSPSESSSCSGYFSNDSVASPPITKENKENIPSKGKNNRTAFSDYQKQQLEVYFQVNPYPDPRETEELSKRLELGEAVIKVWFQNKRSRDKQRKFSHANRAARRAITNNLNKNAAMMGSPIMNNLQMLSSKLNGYSNLINQLQQQQGLGMINGSFM